MRLPGILAFTIIFPLIHACGSSDAQRCITTESTGFTGIAPAGAKALQFTVCDVATKYCAALTPPPPGAPGKWTAQVRPDLACDFDFSRAAPGDAPNAYSLAMDCTYATDASGHSPAEQGDFELYVKSPNTHWDLAAAGSFGMTNLCSDDGRAAGALRPVRPTQASVGAPEPASCAPTTVAASHSPPATTRAPYGQRKCTAKQTADYVAACVAPAAANEGANDPNGVCASFKASNPDCAACIEPPTPAVTGRGPLVATVKNPGSASPDVACLDRIDAGLGQTVQALRDCAGAACAHLEDACLQACVRWAEREPTACASEHAAAEAALAKADRAKVNVCVPPGGATPSQTDELATEMITLYCGDGT